MNFKAGKASYNKKGSQSQVVPPPPVQVSIRGEMTCEVTQGSRWISELFPRPRASCTASVLRPSPLLRGICTPSSLSFGYNHDSFTPSEFKLSCPFLSIHVAHTHLCLSSSPSLLPSGMFKLDPHHLLCGFHSYYVMFPVLHLLFNWHFSNSLLLILSFISIKVAFSYVRPLVSFASPLEFLSL